jgi:DNA-binding XRE family transcriptional regulator
MPKTLNPEQIKALRAVPLGSMPNKLRIALALVEARQSEVAAEIAYPVPSLSNLVNGKVEPTIGTARKLSSYFGCSIEDLFPAREAVAS